MISWCHPLPNLAIYNWAIANKQKLIWHAWLLSNYKNANKITHRSNKIFNLRCRKLISYCFQDFSVPEFLHQMWKKLGLYLWHIYHLSSDKLITPLFHILMIKYSAAFCWMGHRSPQAFLLSYSVSSFSYCVAWDHYKSSAGSEQRHIQSNILLTGGNHMLIGSLQARPEYNSILLSCDS